MAAFYPAIGNEVLPSDFLLRQMGVPALALLFQLMIFLALVESGVGAVHAINERIAHSLQSHGRPLYFLSPLSDELVPVLTLPLINLQHA